MLRLHSKQLKSLQSQPIDLDASSNSLGLNTNIVALKREERRSTISPTTVCKVIENTIYAHCNYVCILQKQNIKRIEESTSPYLNIKSSSVGLAHLLKPPDMGITKISPIKSGAGISMATGVIRKTHSDLSEKVIQVHIDIIVFYSLIGIFYSPAVLNFQEATSAAGRLQFGCPNERQFCVQWHGRFGEDRSICAACSGGGAAGSIS